jgi:hypothetical protein
MRSLFLGAVFLAFAALPAAANAEEFHVTTVITGPSEVSPGSEATYDVDVTVVGSGGADVYITWLTPVPTGAAADVCCDYLTSSVQSGQARILGALWGQPMVWDVTAPGAKFRIVLRIYDTVDTDVVKVDAYLPGTDVAQYETVTPAVSRVVRLPRTGGPPQTESRHGYGLMLAGAALLLAAAACVVGARSVRTGEMP